LPICGIQSKPPDQGMLTTSVTAPLAKETITEVSRRRPQA
jgi:hypothetical protein